MNEDDYNALSLDEQLKRDRLIAAEKQKKMERESEITANLHYKHYLKTLQDYFVDNNDIKNKDRIIEDLKNSKQHIYSLIFTITKKYEIVTDDETYCVYYTVTKKKAFGQMNLKKKKKNEKLIDESEIKDNQMESISKIVVNAQDNNSMSSMSEHSSSVNNRFRASGMEKLKLDEKTDFEKLNIFSRLTKGLNFCIIIFSIVFIVILSIKDKEFRELFELFSQYKYFVRGTQTEVMRLISNLCLYLNESDEKNNINCTCYFCDKYRITLDPSFEREFDLSISKMIYLQFIKNYQLISEQFLTFRQSIYDLSAQYVEEIEKEEIYMPITSSEINHNSSKKNVQIESFLEGMSMYINYLVQIINSGTLTETPIKLFEITRTYELKNLNIEECSQEQRNIYAIILNYPFIEKALLNVKELIKNWFVNRLNTINDILIGFSVAIVVLHIILIVIVILFIYEFIIILNRKLETIKGNLGSASFMNYFKTKFLHLKVLLTLYDKTPMEVINVISKEKDEYLKVKVIEKKEEVLIPIKVQKKQRRENIKSFSTLKINNILIVCFIYFFYFILFVVFFILMFSKLQTLKTLVDFVNNNAEIDDDLSLTLNGLQIMIITNTTEYDFGYFIKGNASYPMISNLIRDHLYLMKLIKATEDSNEATYKEISQFDKIGCEDLRTFNDIEFESIIPEGQKDRYYDYLIAVCNSYGVLEYKSQDLVMDNIIYLENKLVSRIEKVPYNDKFTNLDLTELSFKKK